MEKMKNRDKTGKYKRLAVLKSILYKLYIIDKNTPKQISKKLDISMHVIYERLHEYGLFVRITHKPHINHKINCLCAICKAKRGEIAGKNNPAYIDGRYINNYFCKCGKKISNRAYITGHGFCRSCWHLDKDIRKRMGRKAGSIPWNKGKITGVKSWCKGKNLSERSVIHHIDCNHNNNVKDNLLSLKWGEHRSIHWRTYDYIVENMNINEYLSEFMQKYCINLEKGNCKVMHHIDGNRNNNIETNHLYLKDRQIHNKLHQEAYLYVVKQNKIHDYFKWFFLRRRKITIQLKANEELCNRERNLKGGYTDDPR
jgi:hypothetical protein